MILVATLLVLFRAPREASRIAFSAGWSSSSHFLSVLSVLGVLRCSKSRAINQATNLLDRLLSPWTIKMSNRQETCTKWLAFDDSSIGATSRMSQTLFTASTVPEPATTRRRQPCRTPNWGETTWWKMKVHPRSGSPREFGYPNPGPGAEFKRCNAAQPREMEISPYRSRA